MADWRKTLSTTFSWPRFIQIGIEEAYKGIWRTVWKISIRGAAVCLILLTAAVSAILAGVHKHWLYALVGGVVTFFVLAVSLVIVAYFMIRRGAQESQSLASGFTFRDYTYDIFYDILWRWQYNSRFGSYPYEITPYCSQCEIVYGRKQKLENLMSGLKCCFCHTSYHWPSASISDEIQAKLKDGSWIDVVNNRKTK